MITSELRYTLVADGTSDRALVPILTWLLRQIRQLESATLWPQFADRDQFPEGTHGLAERIRAAVYLFPCELLFVHRDAEREAREVRIGEISAALPQVCPACVCVLPVRMTEAWLLINERAIRTAAGNPNGASALTVPPLRDPETLVDPKAVLRTLLIEATELQGRRRRRFERDLGDRVQRVAQLIDDFSPLRKLPAFEVLEMDVVRAVACLVGGGSSFQGIDNCPVDDE